MVFENERVSSAFSIKALISDAPECSFLRCTVTHTRVHNNRIVIMNLKMHLARVLKHWLTTFVYSELSCIAEFVLDYMHLVCLAVTKMMLSYMISGPRVSNISKSRLERIL